MSCVFGYTIGNDVSERTWQKADRGLWRAKNADTFKPMGPWIETDVDLDKMETIVEVNGKESNRFRTNDMIFGIKPFIVELTKYFTLWPGRRDLDGHRRRLARPEGRRRRRDRDHRHRHLAQPVRRGERRQAMQPSVTSQDAAALRPARRDQPDDDGRDRRNGDIEDQRAEPDIEHIADAAEIDASRAASARCSTPSTIPRRYRRPSRAAGLRRGTSA